MGVERSMGDFLTRGLVGQSARYLAVDATAIAEQTRQLHELRRDAVRVAAEGLVASIFLSAHIKGEERITLQIQGSKPECAFMCDVDALGGLRARLTPEVLVLPPMGRMEGMLMVAKSLPGQVPYCGVTAIEAETLESALHRHLGASAQVDAVLRIGADIGDDGTILRAGGVLLERLPSPGVNEDEAAAAFAVGFDPLRFQTISEILKSLRDGSVEGVPVVQLDSRALAWRCSCGQERVEAVLATLPAADLQLMIDEDDGAEVICHFCNVGYQVSAERLKRFIDGRS
jgi:molecular chaperone Hsp33